MSGWAALAKVGGDLASSALGLYASSKAWRRQREAAQNAHQWEVADLRKAGLNPILSATGGSGASAGSASVPAGLGVNLGEAYNAMNANDLTKAQVDTQRAQQGLLQAQTDLAESQNYGVHANAAKAFADADVQAQHTRMLKRENDYLDTPEGRKMIRGQWHQKGFGALGGITGLSSAIQFATEGNK